MVSYIFSFIVAVLTMSYSTSSIGYLRFLVEEKPKDFLWFGILLCIIISLEPSVSSGHSGNLLYSILSGATLLIFIIKFLLITFNVFYIGGMFSYGLKRQEHVLNSQTMKNDGHIFGIREGIVFAISVGLFFQFLITNIALVLHVFGLNEVAEIISGLSGIIGLFYMVRAVNMYYEINDSLYLFTVVLAPIVFFIIVGKLLYYFL